MNEKITVRETPYPACGSPSFQVSHRSFPEMQITGLTVRRAAEYLAARLKSDLDAVSTPACRDRSLSAIADVLAFLEAERAGQAPGRRASANVPR